MKTLIPILFPFLFIAFLFSCTDNSKPAEIKVLTSKENFLPDSSKLRLLKIIEGGWVNEEYINAFKKYFSPMTVASFGLPQRQMAFDISQMNGDTLINALGSINYNEAEHFDVVFYKKADGKIGMEINARQNNISPTAILNYSIEGKDTVLLLTITEGNKTLTQRYKNQFRKFPESDDVHLTAIEYFVNQNLFWGDWKTTEGQIISFTPDGRITNFRGYKRYSITTSEENASSRPDEISFYNDSAGVTCSFIYKNSDLIFYEITESDDGLKFSVGKKIIEMRKLVR